MDAYTPDADATDAPTPPPDIVGDSISDSPPPPDAPIDAPTAPRRCGPSAQLAQCRVLPTNGTATLQTIAPSDAADVVLLVDETESMQPAINELTRALASLIGTVRTAYIPDARFGIASFRDFPVGEYGVVGDLPYVRHSTFSPDYWASRNALNGLVARGGADVPESAVEALYQIATNEGLPGLVSPTTDCPPGTSGAHCFRPEAAHLVVVVTDAASHEGPVTVDPYDLAAFTASGATYRPHTWAQTLAALRAQRVRVLGINVGNGSWQQQDLEGYARETGALDAAGAPLVLSTDTEGRGIDASLIDAITLFRGERYRRISARVVDCATDGPFVDGLRGVRVTSVAPRGPSTRIEGATVFDPPQGATLDLAVDFDPASLRPGTGRLVRVEIVGDETQILGTYELDVYGAGSVPVGCR